MRYLDRWRRRLHLDLQREINWSPVPLLPGAAGEIYQVDGNANVQTDGNGKFTLRVLKGLTGELFGEDWLFSGAYKNCPKVAELLAKSGRNNVTVQSNFVKLTSVRK